MVFGELTTLSVRNIVNFFVWKYLNNYKNYILEEEEKLKN